MSCSHLFLLFSGVVCALLLFVDNSSALICFQCNSHNDSRCADVAVPDLFNVECPKTDKNGHELKLCRKIKQIIEFEVNGMPPDTRIIRSCGWDESSYKGACYQRSGFGGRQIVCACNDDGCNSAPLTMSTAALPLAAAIVALLKMCMWGGTFKSHRSIFQLYTF